jgi:hypothetical protein
MGNRSSSFTVLERGRLMHNVLKRVFSYLLVLSLIGLITAITEAADKIGLVP